MLNMQYDEEGLKLTESYEGFRDTAYPDVVGVWTIGYGHTGPDVKPGLKITQEQGEALLRSDVAAAVACVRSHVTQQLTQHQFDALVDFTFNEGSGNFSKSTLLRCVNAGDFAGAASHFMDWVYAGGRKFDGLVRRRTGERTLFME